MSANMEDRDGFIWFDGKILPWREVKAHVLTHALHYGSAVFDGERIYDGRVFRLAAHSARLINSARLLDYDLPWTGEQIAEANVRGRHGDRGDRHHHARLGPQVGRRGRRRHDNAESQG